MGQRFRMGGGGHLPFSWFGWVLFSLFFLSCIAGGGTDPQTYSQVGTYGNDYESLGVVKSVKKLPPTFVFNPIVAPTVSRLAVLGVVEGVNVPGIPSERIRDSDVILVNSQAVIGLLAMDTSARAQAGTPPSISEALNTFLLMAAANAQMLLANQAARLASLAAILGSVPQLPSPVRVPTDPIPTLALANSATMVATAPSLLNALSALGTIAEVNEAAGLSSVAERDVIRSNTENIGTLVRLAAGIAQITVDIQAERDAAALTPVQIDTPGKTRGLLGGLVKITDSDVLNNLGGDILTNVQVVSNGATITNTGTDGGLDSGDQGLLGGILKPLLQGVQGRAAKTEGGAHLAENSLTVPRSDASKPARSLSQSELGQLIELNNQLEFLLNHIQQQNGMQPTYSSQSNIRLQPQIQRGDQSRSAPALYSSFG